MGAAEHRRRDAQRRAALEKANQIRRVRADLRERVRSGEVDALALVAGEYELLEEAIANWRIEQLLRVIKGIGAVASQEIYEVGPFSPRQRVSSLSKTRRLRLRKLCAEALGQR